MIQTTALWKSGTCLALLVRLLLCLARVNNGSWPCSRERMVYSSQSFYSQTVVQGVPLLYTGTDPIVLQHPCGNNVGGVAPAIYLGNKVFLSFDRFESSLLPLTIPATLGITHASVSSAVFVQATQIVLVINRKVFIYLYEPFQSWEESKGINSPVTEITNAGCCYARSDPTCSNISSFVLAYDKGNLVSNIQVFFSTDGGYRFIGIPMISPFLHGRLLSVYNFISLSKFGVLTKNTEANKTTAKFLYYSRHSTYSYEGTAFDLNDTADLMITVPSGLRGFIIFWTKDMFLLSSNNGLSTENITVFPTNNYPNTSLPLNNQGVCNVATTSTEVAALTKNQKLFYGSLDIVLSKMVLIGDRNSSKIPPQCEVLMFDGTGMLTILNPVPSNLSGFYNFHKCTINLQDRLMNVRPHLEPCPVEIFSGDFHNKMYYIDMKKELHFNVTFVPKPGTGAFPYVTVSNPQILGFRARIMQDGYTYDGNIQFRLQIILLQQQDSGMAQSELYDKRASDGISTLTVDIYNKGIFCIDMRPLTALIAMNCPPKKHIRPFKNTTACNKGLFNRTNLQDSFSYIIKQDVYDPAFLGRQNLHQGDLNVTYPYELLGCPILLYYDNPWLPTLELWENDKFVEYVSADFVLFEINGMHNYDYLLTASEAKCISQPQNWSTMFEFQIQPNPHTAWSRKNYESCKVPSQARPLESPSIKYQILNLNEKNRVVFSQYNGIYIFKVVVVDTIYSYCELSTHFSVYVHGALPESQINVAGMLFGILTLIFGSILIGYFFPKLLHLSENAERKSI